MINLLYIVCFVFCVLCFVFCVLCFVLYKVKKIKNNQNINYIFVVYSRLILFHNCVYLIY